MTDEKTPHNEEPDDEANGFGRYRPEHQPFGEDELYAVILALVRQGCENGTAGQLDSWAISAYERGIEALAEAGFVEIEREGRIFAKLLPKAEKFEAWMELHDRRKRVREAKHRLATASDVTPKGLASLYNITIAELMGEELPESEG
jgi:hypothetical protein